MKNRHYIATFVILAALLLGLFFLHLQAGFHYFTKEHLLAILFFGGETIRGFMFALALGVVVGTLSTLFVATPIAYGLMKREGLGKK